MSKSVKSDRIAKLLATEDLSVRHSVTAKTASFDTNNRILTLPVYLVQNDDVHDMMTGHEVGHALWTKSIDWMTALTNDYNKDILNIVEDARIEKKIKIRYPGIVRNFIEGYNILAGNKFFYDDESQIVDMQFIDRMNLYFKLGLSAKVKFNAEEQELIEMVADCNSWKDVLAATRAIMEFTAQEMRNAEVEELDGEGQEGESMEMSPENGFGDIEGMSNEELSEELDFQNMKSETQEKFDENAEKMTEGEKNEAKSKWKTEELHYGRLPKANLGKVVVPYKKILKDLDYDIEYSRNYAIAEANQHGVEKHFYANMDGDYVTFSTIDSRYKTFRQKTAKIVNYMVKEFERKKSAAEYRKEHISKTGVLDVNKLFSYKYNEDVFLKNIIRPDGKNHGMVFLLDWSASMTDNLGPTINQLLALIWFCKKINVPFEVYAFTNSYVQTHDDSFADYTTHRFSREPGEIKHGNDTCFNLLQLFSTKMNAADLNKMCKQLYLFAHAYNGLRYSGSRLNMGSTPLVEGLACMTQIVPMLKNNYNLDIVNMFVLTDGDGNSRFDTVQLESGEKPEVVGEQFVLENPDTKQSHHTGELGRSLRNQGSYNYNNSWIKMKGQEYAVLNIIKEIPGVNIVGIFLDGSSSNSRYSKHVHDKFMPTRMWSEMKRKHIEQRKEMKKYGFTSHKWMSFDAFYIIPAATMREKTEELAITSDMKAGQMKRIFGQHQKKKWNSKVFVNRLMEIIC